jgi:hypothetical protein
MGLLDRVMDMGFLPNTGSVVVRSSQWRVFCFNVSWLEKGQILYYLENERDAH